MIHEYVLMRIIETEGYSAIADGRDAMLLWAFANALKLLRDQKDYLAANKIRVEFSRRHSHVQVWLEVRGAKDARSAAFPWEK